MSHFMIPFVEGGGGSEVPLCPLDTAATGWSIVPALGEYDDGELG
jgi:hypothetical protein